MVREEEFWTVVFPCALLFIGVKYGIPMCMVKYLEMGRDESMPYRSMSINGDGLRLYFEGEMLW